MVQFPRLRGFPCVRVPSTRDSALSHSLGPGAWDQCPHQHGCVQPLPCARFHRDRSELSHKADHGSVTGHGTATDTGGFSADLSERLIQAAVWLFKKIL